MWGWASWGQFSGGWGYISDRFRRVGLVRSHINIECYVASTFKM